MLAKWPETAQQGEIGGNMAMLRMGGDEGAGLIEYALVVALIALVALGAVGFVGGEVSSAFDDTGTALSGDTQTSPNPSPPGLCPGPGTPNPVGGPGRPPPPSQNCP